jgi:hypothetical protein
MRDLEHRAAFRKADATAFDGCIVASRQHAYYYESVYVLANVGWTLPSSDFLKINYHSP